MMTSSNKNIFRVTGPIARGIHRSRWIPRQRPMTRSFDVFIDLRLNKRGELFMHPREGYFGVYLPNCAATREMNTEITLEWVHKQFATKVHTLFLFLTRYKESINDAKTWILTHNTSVSLARFTFCLWRHHRYAMTSQWPDNCYANTGQVISNSLDIDFIHGGIHGGSC